MSTNKKNRYKKKADKESLAGIADNLKKAKENTKNGMEVKVKISHLILGGIAGGVTGVATGRASLLLGMAVTGIGAAFNYPSTAMFGVGMMASGGYQAVAGSFQGTDSVDGIKERFKEFTSRLKHQLYLDKLKFGKDKKKEAEKTEKTEATNGMGQLDFTEANRIEQQIAESARLYESSNGSTGVDGIEERLL